ncbi:substrate-binding domain-containing protein, partial [Streptomyces sp. Vc17.3-30]|uniref:substrate-binding domain-containing protein n=1 Tax=Streptomyces sp. Vc17.3-30 TaxID=2841672 RepID=UPI002094903D
EPPTAVFCGNDVVAIGVLNAALATGLQVPGDLTVIGFDDLPMAAWEAYIWSASRPQAPGRRPLRGRSTDMTPRRSRP